MQINIKSLVILAKITTGKNLIFVSPEFYLSIDLSHSLSIFYPSVSLKRTYHIYNSAF